MNSLMLRAISILFLCASAFGQPFTFHDPAWPTGSASSAFPVFGGIAAVWHFNGTNPIGAGNTTPDSVDSSGLTFGGSGTVMYTNGMAGNAYACMTENNTANFNVIDNPVVGAGSGVSFTFSFWFNDQGGTDSNNPLIAKWNSGASPEFEYVCAFVKPSLGLIWQCNNLAGSAQPFVNVTAPSSSAWHFAVVGYDDSIQKIFMQVDNGTRVTTTCVGVKRDVSNTASFAVGNYSQNNQPVSSSWKGYIDELYLWKRALSTAEVTTLWAGGSGLFYTP